MDYKVKIETVIKYSPDVPKVFAKVNDLIEELSEHHTLQYVLINIDEVERKEDADA